MSQQQVSMRCGLCAAEIPPQATQCPSCRALLLPPPSRDQTRWDLPYVEDRESRSRWPILLSLLGIVGAVAVIVFAIRPFLGSDDEELTIVPDSTVAAGTTAPGPLVDLGTTTVAAAPAETAVVSETVAPIVPAGPIAVNLVQASCTARGSTDSRGNPIDFRPENTTDGVNDTAWRCEGSGVGETITYTFPAPVRVAQLGMVPGYAKVDDFNGDDRFTQNRRVTGATWRCLDAAGAELAVASQTLSDSRSMQVIDLPDFAQCAAVQLEITGASTPGSRDFVAISDVTLISG